jgi:hypothetical protein
MRGRLETGGGKRGETGETGKRGTDGTFLDSFSFPTSNEPLTLLRNHPILNFPHSLDGWDEWLVRKPLDDLGCPTLGL